MYTVLGPGDRLDRYEILKSIGIGGMGRVWLGRFVGKHGFARLVAIKTLLPGLATEPEFRKMLLDEARIAARLEHANVAQVLDVCEYDGLPYIVFEWVEGVSLLKICRAAESRGRLVPHGPLLRVLADVSRGLHAAHELTSEDGTSLGVVHRDVTPSNIMVSSGYAKVIDFGIAKAKGRLAAETRTGAVKGTPHYMAPEQVLGGDVDRRADVWALGAVLYRCLTGAPAFDTVRDLSRFASGSGEAAVPVPAGLPSALTTILRRTLCRDPSHRFQDAEGVRLALEAAVGAAESGPPFEELLQSELWVAEQQSVRSVTVSMPALPASAIDSEPVLSKGATLGRYVVLEPIGRGGMGIVYAAYDPVLNRRVAVKLLRRASRDSEQQRLLREGMVMASLSHPNIVTVHDVGTFAQRLFVAMELVDGQTLRAWSQEPRSWRETVAMYVQAGRGLAGAHAVGIVHRDFKPDNVIVGQDGRPRVLDFGVALNVGEIMNAERLEIEGPDEGAPGSMPLVGTPRYMPAEQLLGKEVDQRADQFAFCASLWESLYGVPPFEGHDVLELLDSVSMGRPRVEAGREVPGRIRAALERGLAVASADRFPSMDALLAALQHDPVVSRRRYLALAGAAIAGAVLLFAVEHTKAVAPADPCAHPERELAGTWDDAAKTRIRAAFSATDRPYASDMAARVSAMLDDYAAHYTKMRGEICVAARDGKGSADLRVLRDVCLDRRRGQLQALASALAEKPDPGALDKAVSAAASLPPIGDCADVSTLASHVSPPEDPAARARVAGLLHDVDRADALLTLGRYREGLSLADATVEAAADVNYSHLSAQAEFVAGQLRSRTGEDDAAKKLLREAAAHAAAANDNALVAKAWASVLFVVAEQQRHADEATQLLAFGPTLLELAHDDRVELTWRTYEGLALWRMGRLIEAKAAHERSLTLAEKLLSPNDPQLGAVLNNLALTLTDLGEYSAALAAHQRALSSRQGTLGAGHPLVATSFNNMGLVYGARGDLPEAKQAYEHALSIWQLTLGPTHPSAATAENNVGAILQRMGDLPRAIETTEHALATRENVLGPDHPDVAQSLCNLGEALILAGQAERAVSVLERSASIVEKAMGPDRRELAYPLNALGRARIRLHQLDAARVALNRALVLADKPGAETMILAPTLLGHGELALAQGRPRDAIPPLERAVSISVADYRAQIELALAEALWMSKTDPSRGRALAEESRAYYASIGHRPGTERATRWLAEHP